MSHEHSRFTCPPAGLHQADARLAERRQRTPQEVARRQEVGVEDGDRLAPRGPQPGRQRAGLVAGPLGPVQPADGDPARGPAGHGRGRNPLRLVGRVVQDLDLQALRGVVQARRRVDETLDHVQLVVDGKLHGDERDVVVVVDPRRRRPGPISCIKVEQVGAVQAVGAQADEKHEIQPYQEGSG